MGVLEDRVDAYVKAVKEHIVSHFEHPYWGKGPLKERVAKAYSEEYLEWLESFCVGDGFNMGCGEIPIGDSQGVDMILSLGCWRGVAYANMDHMWNYKDGIADYIVSNYVEGASSPCQLFTEWFRLMKPGGVLALLVQDADDSVYDRDPYGPLQRSGKGGIKKFNCYTARTIRFYLTFVGFIVDSVEKVDGAVLKVVAHKNK